MEQIGQKMASGSVWMLMFTVTDRALGFISTIILARLLLPADFGVMSMAMSLVVILELFSNFNFDIVLISKSGVQRQHYDTAWTFSVIVSASIALLLVALAIPASIFYREPRLEGVMYVLAVAALVQGFQNIGVVAFRKEMEFHKEFRFLAGKKIAGFLVTVPLAFVLRDYWALIIGILTTRVAGIALSYYAHPYRPRLSLAARHELFHFSKWLLANNVSNFGRERSSDFVIGRLVGPSGLGLYNIAYEIAILPTTELVAPVNRAIFPVYAKLANDLDELRRRYLQVVAMVALIALPAAIGISLTADMFVPLLLGSQWLDTVKLIEILALGGAIGALQSSSWIVFLALGKARTVAYLGLVSLAMMLPLLWVSTSKYGPEGAAMAFLIIMLFLVCVTYSLLLQDLALRLRDLLRGFLRPVLGIVLMAVVVLSLETHWAVAAGNAGQSLRLFLVVMAGAVTYSVVVLLLWLAFGRPDGAERVMLDRLWPMLRARLRRNSPGE